MEGSFFTYDFYMGDMFDVPYGGRISSNSFIDFGSSAIIPVQITDSARANGNSKSSSVGVGVKYSMLCGSEVERQV